MPLISDLILFCAVFSPTVHTAKHTPNNFSALGASCCWISISLNFPCGILYGRRDTIKLRHTRSQALVLRQPPSSSSSNRIRISIFLRYHARSRPGKMTTCYLPSGDESDKMRPCGEESDQGRHCCYEGHYCLSSLLCLVPGDLSAY